MQDPCECRRANEAYSFLTATLCSVLAQFGKVVNWAFLTFYVFFMAVGLFCYLSFSSITSSSITAAVGAYYDGTLVKAVNLLVALAVGFTYPGAQRCVKTSSLLLTSIWDPSVFVPA